MTGRRSAAALGLALATSPAAAQAVDLTTDHTLYMVSTAHLDTQWLWSVKFTIGTGIPNTIGTNVNLINKYPNYRFNWEGAIRYAFTKEYYPDDFAKLKQLVAAKRWHVTGRFMDAGDMNVPSSESLVRQALYANHFFLRELGVEGGTDLFLPDCFGFGYAIPTIASHVGIKGFSTMKLQAWGAAETIPFDIGRWEGPDGRSIVAALKPDHYMTDYKGRGSYGDRIDRLGKAANVWAGFGYFGTGDQGGAPSDASAAAVNNDTGSAGAFQVVAADSDQLFRDLTPEQIARLPVHKGELLMRTHGVGTYTTQGTMKWANRWGEVLADAAERSSVAAAWLGVAPYPRDWLADAWMRLLWHQGHDDITGTSIADVYRISVNDEALVHNQFASTLLSSIGGVARALDTRAVGVPVVVWNSLSGDREDVVEADVVLPEGAAKAVRVFDGAGAEVPAQVVDAPASPLRPSGATRVAFVARVPSVGYAVFDVRAADAPASAGSLRVDATARTLENDQLLVTLNAAGDVAQIRDKRAGRDVLSAPIQLQMFQLGGTGFPQWEIRPDDLVGKKPREAVAGAPTIRVADAGPARVALEITRTQGGSKFVQTVSLASGDAGAVVQVGNHIDWQTHQTLLKAAFPLTSANPKATFGLGVGTIDRGNATGDKYEVPAQHWADLTAPDGSAGAAILSDFKYGWDKPTNDTLRLSLLHTPYVADNTGYQRPYAEQNDLGPHRMTYAIYPHAGTWSAALVDLRAARLSQPLVAVQTAKHEGPLGRTFSLVSVSPARVAIAAVKEAEDSDEVVVRLQELTGAAAPGTKVSFARPITAAREIDGVEKPVGAATVTDGALVTDLPGYDLRAFAVKLAGPPVALTAPSSQPVELPYDVDVVSTRTAKTDGDMDGMGHTFRAELFPQTVTHGAITFKLGPSASKMMNAIAANGQRVALPDGNWNRVYVLAAAIGGEQKGTFRIGDRAVDVTVQDWNAKLATAFNGNDQPETIKRDEVAWTASHRHDARGNADAETHELTNLFQYHFDVPESGDRTLVLPANKNIRVLAVTVARNDNDFAWPADPGFPIGGDHGVIAPPLNGPAPDLAPNQPGDGSSGAAGSIAGSSGSGGGRSGAAGRSGDRADGGAQGDPAAGSTRGGCSCSFTEPSRGGAFVAFATAAAWAWRRRRRRTRSRQRV